MENLQDTVKADKYNYIRRRKNWRNEYFRKNGTITVTDDINNSASTESGISQSQETEQSINIVGKLRDKFHKKVFHYLTEVCYFCDMMIYNHKNHRKVITLSQHHVDLLRTVDPCFHTHLKTVTLCCRCDRNLLRNKVPAKAKINKMALPPVPEEIKCLSTAEVRLITQVKAYIKVYLLCNGRGQKASKGMVVHFPTEVTEVIKQLPLTTIEADFIVVREKSDNTELAPAIQINPAKIIQALKWLQKHNPLYKDVQINENADPKEMQSIVITRSQSQIPTFYHQHNRGDRGYTTIGNDVSILHASFSQGNTQLFGCAAGNQCTAMSGSFIAHCRIQAPDIWTCQTLDGVLMAGNEFYLQRKAALPHRHRYLAPDEVATTIDVFQGAEVQLSIDNSTQAIQFVGYSTKCKRMDLPKLDETLRRFLDAGYTNGILTINNYSMAMHVYDESVFYFDSHGRGAKGGKTRSHEGTACVLKFPYDSAHHQISVKVNINCLSIRTNEESEEENEYDDDYDGDDVQRFRFTLVVFEAAFEDEGQSARDSSSQIVSAMRSPRKKKQRVEDYGPETSSEDEDEIEEPAVPQEEQSLPVFGVMAEGDCVIDRDDPIAPKIDKVLQEYELNRPRLPPISSQYEENLDLLAFPHLYPHGTNGLHADRIIPITPLDYYQQRFMSPDQRFAGESEALFAALADCDKHRIKQKIAVCCQQKKQGRGAAANTPEGLQNLSQEDLLGVRDPHVYMSGIRGSSSYWRQYTGDLIAMVKNLGRPTFFLTFSYDDLNSFDSVNALWKAKHGPQTPDVNPQDVPYEIRRQLLNDYPIVAARHFSMRLSKFMLLIKQNGRDIFGRSLEDYSVRVEFQARGSPHAHMLLWLKDVPDWDTTEGIEFIEKNVSCTLSTQYKDIVLKYQKHAHSKTCFKNNNSSCRFGFEKPASEHTKILNEHEIIQNKGRFFVLKRTKEERMIGYYHPILLPVLLCNMDIQIVTSAVGVAYYIAKYMSKAEPMDIRQGIKDSISKIQNSNIPAKTKMFKVAMTLMRNREISAQEAAFRLCHLYLRDSSRSTIFIPTFLKDNRVRMLRKESIAEGQVEFCTNIIDRYEARPQTDEFEAMCLAEFASNYELVPRRNYKEDNVADDDLIEFPMTPDVDDGNTRRPQFRCINRAGHEIGRIRKRNKSAIIKHPNFHPISDSDSYYYSMLLLYLPFREENFCDGISPSDVFQQRHTEFRTYADDPCLRRELGEEIDRALLFVSEFNEEEREDVDLENVFDPQYEDGERSQPPPPEANDVFPVINHGRTPAMYNKLKRLVKGLNPEQRAIFNKFHNAIRNNETGIKQILLAEGGTGKSHLISVLAMLIRYMLGHDSLLIGAPTGKASFAIRGMTLHRLFQLPIQRGWINSYQKLNDKRLSEFRKRYRNVQYIFIDEISMVSYESFRTIHLRLCEIFGTDGSEAFSNKNILVVGDLMQLPPVKSSRVFKKPRIFSAEPDLWRQFEFSELTTNMRQHNDPLANVCSELRVGKLSGDSLKLLRSRLLSCMSSAIAETWDNAVHIFPENENCRRHNNDKLKKLQSSGVKVTEINAYDTYADGPKQGKKVDPKEIPKKEEDTGGIPTSIKLAIGAKVMLRSNLNTEEGNLV